MRRASRTSPSETSMNAPIAPVRHASSAAARGGLGRKKSSISRPSKPGSVPASRVYPRSRRANPAAPWPSTPAWMSGSEASAELRNRGFRPSSTPMTVTEMTMESPPTRSPPSTPAPADRHASALARAKSSTHPWIRPARWAGHPSLRRRRGSAWRRASPRRRRLTRCGGSGGLPRACRWRRRHARRMRRGPRSRLLWGRWRHPIPEDGAR